MLLYYLRELNLALVLCPGAAQFAQLIFEDWSESANASSGCPWVLAQGENSAFCIALRSVFAGRCRSLSADGHDAIFASLRAMVPRKI